MVIARRRPEQRLRGLLHHLATATARPVVVGGGSGGESSRVDGVFGELPLLEWSEIQQHNTAKDLWVVIEGRVWDMTEFITHAHPGGEDIPTEYGGKDATDFWVDMHGHVREDILSDLTMGEGEITGLDTLPKLIGLTAEPPSPDQMGEAGRERYTTRNWADTVAWQHEGGPAGFLEPQNLEQLCQMVASNASVRVLGRGHSFHDICDSAPGGVVISLMRHMDRVLAVDTVANTVTVEGGTSHSQLIQHLREHTTLALSTMASLPHTTLAGSVGTGSHGSSGVSPATGCALLPSTSGLVTALELVLFDGTVKQFSRAADPDIWPGLVTSCGCLGVVSKLTLQLVPLYDVDEVHYNGGSIASFIQNFRKLLTSCDSFNAFMAWPTDTVMWVQLQHYRTLNNQRDAPALPQRAPPSPTLFGEGQLGKPPSPGMGIQAEASPTVRWDRSLLLIMPANIMEELQIEYFVPLEHAEAALHATWEATKGWNTVVDDMAEDNWGQHGGFLTSGSLMNYCHLRVIAADDQWLSQTTTNEGGDTLAIAFGLNRALWGDDGSALYAAAAELEAALAPFDARPHWGKLSNTIREEGKIEALYGEERLGKFRALAREMDPHGKFRNDHVSRSLFGVSSSG